MTEDYRRLIISILFLVVLPARSVAQSAQPVFTKNVDGKSVEVFYDPARDETTVHILSSGNQVDVSLPSLVESFTDAIGFNGRLWLVSDSSSQSTIYVLDSNAGVFLDAIFASRPVFSPNGRFVAYTRWAPRNDATEPGAVYLVYDITANAEQNRMQSASNGLQKYRDVGIAAFPEWNRQTRSYSARESDQGASYLRKSPLFWVDSNSFVFLNQASSTLEAVLVSISGAGIMVNSQAIDTDAIIDASTLPPAVLPAGSVTVSQVSLLENAQGLCRVRFTLPHGFKVPSFDVSWQR